MPSTSLTIFSDGGLRAQRYILTIQRMFMWRPRFFLPEPRLLWARSKGRTAMLRHILALALALVLAPGTATWAGALDDAVAAFDAGDHAAALAVIEPAARQGAARAQAVLGAAFDTGRGKPQSPRLARDWLEKAAAQGSARAQFDLGLMLLEGREGVDADPPRASDLFEAAMRQGYAAAFDARGRMMLDGRAGPADPVGAAALLTTALELGHAPAGIALAQVYLDGNGVAPDAGRARRTLGRAAQLGSGAALRRLGALHEAGQGGPRDLAAAFVLYQEAVNLGDVPAAVDLARLMQAHDGYWTDPPLAYAYCLWAAGQAADAARAETHAETCRELGATMTQAQRKEGRGLLQQF